MAGSLRRSRAGGARKRPARYDGLPASAPLALALRAHRHAAYELAEPLYREALAAGPDSLDARMNLGALLATLGRARDARGELEIAARAAPDDPRVRRDAGVALASVGWLDEGACHLEAAVRLAPEATGGRLTLIRMLLELGRDAEAREHAREAIARAPDNAAAHLEAFRVVWNDADPDAAIDAATRAVSLDPAWSLARLFASGALRRAGRVHEARAVLGGEALVAAGLVSALDHIDHSGPGSRCFASKRQSILHAARHANTQGPMLEFGVRHGVSTRLLAASTSREVHAFDSFLGLPIAWQSMPAGAFATAGLLPDVEGDVHFHPGWFAETLPSFLADEARAPSLVHIDSDLYESARTVLSLLGPRIPTGCVLLFDEYLGNESWRMDEHRAFTEAIARFGWRPRPLSMSFVTGQAAFVIES